MTPLRRNVNLVMDKDTYKKLGNQLDTGKAWKLVRSTVGQELFGRDYVAVPQIESALYYNQLFVFKKLTDPCSMLRLRPPRYKITDSLDDLIKLESSTWIPQFDFSAYNYLDGREMVSEFTFFMESSPNEAVEKSIEITIKEPHIRNAALPALGRTFLNTVSSRGHVLYIITSVVYANYIRIRLRVEAEMSIFKTTQVLPIGFKYKKYKILADGRLETELPTTLKLTNREALWMRPTANLPCLVRNPLWDPMRRRNNNRRPIRNILTVSTRAQPPASRFVPLLQRPVPQPPPIAPFRQNAIVPHNNFPFDRPDEADPRNPERQLLIYIFQQRYQNLLLQNLQRSANQRQQPIVNAY